MKTGGFHPWKNVRRTFSTGCEEAVVGETDGRLAGRKRSWPPVRTAGKPDGKATLPRRRGLGRALQQRRLLEEIQHQLRMMYMAEKGGAA